MGIIATEETTINIDNCEINGSQNFETIGNSLIGFKFVSYISLYLSYNNKSNDINKLKIKYKILLKLNLFKFNSIGVRSNWANVKVISSIIRNNMVGGIIINSHQLNDVTISKCQIYNNKLAGIYSIGELSHTLI